MPSWISSHSSINNKNTHSHHQETLSPSSQTSPAVTQHLHHAYRSSYRQGPQRPHHQLRANPEPRNGEDDKKNHLLLRYVC